MNVLRIIPEALACFALAYMYLAITRYSSLVLVWLVGFFRALASL